MFLYGETQPKSLTFAPSIESAESADRSAADLWDATRDLGTYRDNQSNEWAAKAEAYERRNKAIFEATGLQLDNPMRYDPLKLKPEPGAGGLPEPSARSDIAAQEQAWQARVQALAAERPEFAGIIDAGRPILADAYQITQDAEKRFGEAAADPAIGPLRRMANMLGGGIAGMLRDPIQIAALWAGGGIASAPRGVFFRILQTMFTEAAVNGGVEAGLQIATQDYRRRAGVEHGWQPALEQIGLAAAFGGGFGGLLAGAGEVLRLTGKSVPPEILSRAAEGNAEPGDIAAIGEALGLKLDPETIRTAELAAEQPKLDAAAFGPPPAGIAPHEAEALAARTLRDAEDPPDLLPDMQERFSDWSIPDETALRGAAPDILAVRAKAQELADPIAVALRGGDISDRMAEVRREALAVERRLIAKYGVRRVDDLDDADLTAAERFFLFYDPVPTDRERLDSLGRMIEPVEDLDEAATEIRRLADKLPANPDHMSTQEQDAVGRLLFLGKEIERFGGDPMAVVRASVLEQAGRYLDPSDAEFMAREMVARLGQFINDERSGGRSGQTNGNIAQLLEDTPAGARAGGADGRAGGEGRPAGRGADEAAGQPLPGAGDAERAPLRAAGDTPEPATPEAAEAAGQALVEAGGPTGDVIDLWDAMPAARQADGTVSHVTHAQMIVEADRDEFFGDLIASCKD